jgi:hypothetical protein
MDRHNLMVRETLRTVYSAMQKLAADQEQALLSAFAALEDARAELARLKRVNLTDPVSVAFVVADRSEVRPC